MILFRLIDTNAPWFLEKMRERDEHRKQQWNALALLPPDERKIVERRTLWQWRHQNKTSINGWPLSPGWMPTGEER